MIDFLLSLFNIWVWLVGGILIAITLYKVYADYGPDNYYEPFEYKKAPWHVINIDDEFKRFKLEKINGEWYPKINLREFYLKEAKFVIVVGIIPAMLFTSYLINHEDRPLPSFEELFESKTNR